jgi:DNA-directed RNA polymerase specialized sigma24 family protein
MRQCGDLASTQEVAPDRLVASKETADRIWRALEHLPFEQRTAVIPAKWMA